jgi:hypothetical protein
MKITIHKEDRYFTWELDGIELSVDFDTVLSSHSWKRSKVISLSYKDKFGRTATTFLFRNPFLDNIISNSAGMRDQVVKGAYEYEKQEYILYRLLEGDSLSTINDDIANIERQRKALDDRKAEHHDLEQQIIVEHVEKENENEEVRKQKQKVQELGFQLASEQDATKRAELQEELQVNMALEGHLREEHDLPDRPVLPALGFTVSEEMQKMINVALNPDIPSVTLKNVNPDLAKEALQSNI